MKRSVYTVLLLVFISNSALADKPNGSVYLEGEKGKEALILIHGRGKHPTWKVVDPLRKASHKKLGLHTLSLQMPNEDKMWKKYADDFPEAYAIIKDAIRYLKEEKSISKIFLMGHSMGARMASAFVSDNPDQPIEGLIVAGCRNNGDYPLSCEENLQKVDIPVLDIWGGDNGKDSSAASSRETLLSNQYKQIEISGGNHKFKGHENEFVSSTIEWLKLQQ